MLILGILAIGYYMPRRLMPYVQSPLLGIVTEMPGFSAEEMETYFSSPIEQRMVNIPNTRYIRSVSQDGFSMVTLEFPYGTNMQEAQVEVQSLLNVVQADLPATGANLKPSWILKIDPLNLPILSLSLTGDKSKGWDLARLRELADNELLNRLKFAHPNIYTVSTFGGYRRQLQVRVNREQLKSYGLSILDLKETIDRNNIAKSAGVVTSVVREPILRVDDLAQDARTVSNYPIRTIGDQNIHIKDVAQVLDTTIEPRSAYHYLHGNKIEKGILINVLQNPDASSPTTIDAIEKTIKQFEKDFPGIHFKTAYNNANFIHTLFYNMQEGLVIAIALTGIAILFFLGEIRGTVIALVAIPTSMAMGVLAMAPLGLSLNSSTLIGLLIAIGRLVDDAIIDIHSVKRHLLMGKDRRQATIDGISEVRRSVLGATLVVIIALVPLMVSGGITQLMFMGLCLPIIFGLTFSYFVSMTLTAALCSKFMTLPNLRSNNWFSKYLLIPFQRELDKLEYKYEQLIRWLLHHRFANFVRISLTIIIGFTLYYFIGSEMMPLGDVGQASLQMEMQPGLSFAQTERGVEQLERILIEEGGKKDWLQQASLELGAEGGPGMTTGGAYFTGYQMNSINSASGMLTFSNKDSGRPDIWNIVDRIHKRAMREIPGIRRIQIKEMGSDLMATSLAPIALIVYGDDLNTLYRMGQQVMHIATHQSLNTKTGKPDIAQPFLSWEMTRPTYKVIVDKEKAAAHGLFPASIAEQAYYALRGGFTTEFYRPENKRATTIQIRYKEDERQNLSNLEGMYLTGTSGEQVPLLELVHLESRIGPSSIEHDQLRRVINFGAYYRKDGRPSMDATMDVQMRAMEAINFPPGYGIEARGDMTQMMDSFRTMLTGLMVALVLMYFILVAQFGGFLQPLQMMFSIPLELSGIFFMLWIMHQAFSTVSILGVIIVSGMDIVTAILLVDLIMRYRHQGLPRNEAVIRACPQRLRPILMTSLITIITMAQIAFIPKSGLDAYQPLGTVIVGGLIVGTVLSLLDIPIMHTVVDDVIRWMKVHILKVDPKSLPPVEFENEKI